MKKVVLTSSILVIALLAVLVASTAFAHDDNGKGGKARLNGWEEVPSISTTGKGSFRARVRSDGIHYVLRYEGLETPALFAHIHFADKDVNGGVIAFLCGGGDKPPCPASAGTVEGVIDAADVVGPAAQGIEPGSLTEALRALRRGLVYANVHSQRWTGGEIRGQVGNNGHHRKNGDRK
ncbi:MAG: CHRD domain-containing protein [Gaiellaceae bacterium]